MATNVPFPYPKGGTRVYFLKYLLKTQGVVRWDWGLYLKEKPDVLIGSIGIWKDFVPGNIGYWLVKEHWSKGYMEEAHLPINDFAFNELGFEWMIVTNAVVNIGSRRLKEKTGAKLICLETTEYINKECTLSELWFLKKEYWEKKRIEGKFNEFKYMKVSS